MDEACYCKLWHFATKEDYWRASSAVHVLPQIARPTLIVHSADDPICPAAAMPLEVPESQVVSTPTDAVLRGCFSAPGALLFFTLTALVGTTLWHLPAVSAVSSSSAAAATAVAMARSAIAPDGV